MLPFRSLDPFLRAPRTIAGDGTKNGFPAPNKEPATNQKYGLTGKAPYRFESVFLQRRVKGRVVAGEIDRPRRFSASDTRSRAVASASLYCTLVRPEFYVSAAEALIGQVEISIQAP